MNLTGQAELLKDADHYVADIGLQPASAEAGESGTRMMIPMPVFALKELHQPEPLNVPARVLADRRIGLAVAYAVNEALRVQRKHKADSAKPKETGEAPITAEKI